jgi:hypothetical protein
MDFIGTFVLENYPRFSFAIEGRFRETLAWPGVSDAIEGDLVLTMKRVPYFPHSISSGQRGMMRIAGFNDFPIIIRTVDQPRMDLRFRDLELAIHFELEEAPSTRNEDSFAGYAAGRQ